MRTLLLTVAVSMVLPTSASAQSFQTGGQYSNDERRVSVGLTIPFGGGGSSAEREPRVDFVFDHRQINANGLEVRELVNLRRERPVRLGFTLSESPKMMLNGRQMPELNGRTNISTGLWIGIGVAATAGLGLLVLGSLLDCSAEEECN